MAPRRPADLKPMRRLILVVLLGAAICGGVLGFRHLPGRPSSRQVGHFAGSVRGVAFLGQDVLVAAGEAGLYRVATETGAVTNLVIIPQQSLVDVMVARDIAYVLASATNDRRSILHLIDPADGRVTRSIALGGVVDLAGILPVGWLVVVEAGQVRFLDPGNGRTRARVEVGGGILGAGHLSGPLLYVSRGYSGGVAIIDTDTSSLLDVIEINDRLTEVRVSGRRAYVVGEKGGLGCIDLDTRELSTLDYDDVYVDPDGVAYALVHDAVYKLDGEGRTLEKARLTASLADVIAEGGARLVRVEPDRMLITRGARLYKLEKKGMWKEGPEA